MSELKKATMEHYDRLASCRTYDEFYDEGWGQYVCPLCRSYNCIYSCDNRCPVKKKTGRNFCKDSPWSDMDHEIGLTRKDRHRDTPLPSVLAMRDFLESLDWSDQP